VGTSPKESVGVPDQMTVSQHCKSEGWHPSPLSPPPSSLFCNLCKIVYCRVCICILRPPTPPPHPNFPPSNQEVTSFTHLIWKVYKCPRSKICSCGDKLHGAPGCEAEPFGPILAVPLKPKPVSEKLLWSPGIDSQPGRPVR
jgi:hypothetical protein